MNASPSVISLGSATRDLSAFGLSTMIVHTGASIAQPHGKGNAFIALKERVQNLGWL
jgi:hypothetical protein